MKTLPPSLLAVLLTASILPAGAVVVTTGTPNTTAPSGNPYFDNVGQLNGASAIYLGNGWVLTADHVAPTLPATVTFGGNSYATQAGTWQQLLNPTGSGLTTYADMVMFRLASNPALPSITVSSVQASTGNQITMVGNGRVQESTLTTWNVTPGPGANDDVWTEGGFPPTNSGYKTTATHTVTWGDNIVTGGSVTVNTGIYDTVSFYSTFDQVGLPQEGQGVNGDSGGAAFYKNGATWELIGMTHAVGTLENQPTVSGIPGSTAVYGDQTFFAGLSNYAPQINSIRAVPEASVAALGLLGGLAAFRRRR